MDGVAENFHTEQNRDVAREAGRANRRNVLAAAGFTQARCAKYRSPRQESPCARRKNLWNMPAIFLADCCCCDLPNGCCAGSGGSCDNACASVARQHDPVRRHFAGWYSCARFPSAPGLITSPWPDWAASRITSSASRRWPRTSTSYSKSSGSDAHVYTLVGDQATRAHLTDTIGHGRQASQAGGRVCTDPDRARHV